MTSHTIDTLYRCTRHSSELDDGDGIFRSQELYEELCNHFSAKDVWDSYGFVPGIKVCTT